jgi:predicted MFS family arabinose efflux permease
VLANAAAPALGAMLLRGGGADLVTISCLALCLVAFILALLIAPPRAA